MCLLEIRPCGEVLFCLLGEEEDLLLLFLFPQLVLLAHAPFILSGVKGRRGRRRRARSGKFLSWRGQKRLPFSLGSLFQSVPSSSSDWLNRFASPVRATPHLSVGPQKKTRASPTRLFFFDRSEKKALFLSLSLDVFLPLLSLIFVFSFSLSLSLCLRTRPFPHPSLSSWRWLFCTCFPPPALPRSLALLSPGARRGRRRLAVFADRLLLVSSSESPLSSFVVSPQDREKDTKTTGLPKSTLLVSLLSSFFLFLVLALSCLLLTFSQCGKCIASSRLDGRLTNPRTRHFPVCFSLCPSLGCPASYRSFIRLHVCRRFSQRLRTTISSPSFFSLSFSCSIQTVYFLFLFLVSLSAVRAGRLRTFFPSVCSSSVSSVTKLSRVVCTLHESLSPCVSVYIHLPVAGSVTRLSVSFWFCRFFDFFVFLSSARRLRLLSVLRAFSFPLTLGTELSFFSSSPRTTEKRGRRGCRLSVKEGRAFLLNVLTISCSSFFFFSCFS